MENLLRKGTINLSTKSSTAVSNRYRLRKSLAVIPNTVRRCRPKLWGDEYCRRYATSAIEKPGISSSEAAYSNRVPAKYLFGDGKPARKKRDMNVLGAICR